MDLGCSIVSANDLVSSSSCYFQSHRYSVQSEEREFDTAIGDYFHDFSELIVCYVEIERGEF